MTMESLIGSNVDLEGLSDVEETFSFTDPKDLRQVIRDSLYNAMDHDSLCDHTILVTGFPAEGFIDEDDTDDDDTDDDTDDDNEPLIPRRFKILYLENLQTLFVTMTSQPHETASEVFSQILYEKLVAMHCGQKAIPTGAAEVEMKNVKKMPDKSWRLDNTRYITLALETGFSESGRALARDARIWLEHAESHVAQVIVINISRRRPEISFSVWKAKHQKGGTRSGHTHRATEVQRVCVTLAEERPVADGRICISFEEFFERKPHRGTAEKDIIFSARNLSRVARVVWQGMGILPLAS